MLIDYGTHKYKVVISLHFLLGIEDTDYREVYVSIKDGMHPQLTHDFSAKIKVLVCDPVVKENPELLKKNMITCNVELAQNSTRRWNVWL
jgi:hypothetical protein